MESLLHEGTKEPPLPLFRDDYRDYWSPTTWVPLGYVAGLLAVVSYSLDGDDVMTRRVEWAGIWGDDFDFTGSEPKRSERETSMTVNYSTIVPPRESRHW